MRDDSGRIYMPTPFGPFYGVEKWIGVAPAGTSPLWGVDRVTTPERFKWWSCSWFGRDDAPGCKQGEVDCYKGYPVGSKRCK
jgi:hypothetical protein